ncbi:MAG: hypothetical protein ACON4W_02975 [Parvibaculales bacterium]
MRDEKFKIYVSKVLSALKQNYPNFELKSEITDFDCKVTLLCPDHGEFGTYADRIKTPNGMNCKKCGIETSRKKRTGLQRVSFSEFKERFEERYGTRLKLISSENEYQNFDSILTVKCLEPNHPEFSNSARDLLRYQGCKHCKESQGERLTRIALEDLGIKYEQEKRFASCRDKKELPFDFWLPDFGTLIEFQGKQHEVSADRFGGTKSLHGTQKRDKIKKDWASQNGINLIYISEYRKIKESILENLKPNSTYKPKQVLKRIKEQEEGWVSKKWGAYLQKLNKKHKNKYDFSKTKWVLGQRDISYICPEHGERKGDLQNILKGHGCSLCANNEMTLELVIERSISRFGARFDFSKSVFTGMENEMDIICDTHGLMTITPENHFWLSKGCRDCGGKADDFSPKNFLSKAKAKFGNRFDYSNLGYISTADDVTIRCIRHDHTFSTKPSDHIRNETGACEKCVYENRVKVKSKPITVEGVEYSSMTEAAEKYGLKRSTVHGRIKLGWETDRAFTTPLK